MTMRLSLLAASAVLALATVSAHAAPTGKKLTAQQQRMAECSHQSKGKKGAEHKAFMSACLKGKSMSSTAHSKMAATSSSKKMAQREKMKACNVEAKTKSLKGAARKTFMSSCLKGH
ncbi:PsiF family protein [Dyella sp. A6]|uniref:PsiF family protein n=1 Tax=Dyella aluminiiresistens TaxID=3069105 RepID=UPI002E774151|nr:PsiF family protein [Dyella sp. A6]